MKFYWFIWIPRILMILIILFISLYSLEAFEGKASIGSQFLKFLNNDISGLLLLLVLILTWKHPLWGGITILVLTAALCLYWRTYLLMLIFSVYTIPGLIISLLYIYAHFFRPGPTDLQLITDDNKTEKLP